MFGQRDVLLAGVIGAMLGGLGWILFTHVLTEHPAAGFAPDNPFAWIALFALCSTCSRAIDKKFGLVTW